jgi:glyoxylase-like metal-dependent hydrolase (beta-lactamase superfamily II)
MLIQVRDRSPVAVAPAPSLSLAAAAGGGSLLFRQLFDADTGTFTYLLADVPSRKGVIIDSVFEQHGRDLSLIRELGIELVASIDTHAHADHVTGSWLMHEPPAVPSGWPPSSAPKTSACPLPRGSSRLRRSLLRGAQYPRPHRWLHQLRARRPINGLQRRCPAGAGLRPL